jgi:prepilin-type processing-associated H-X9-DG protein
MRQIGSALHLYGVEHGGRLPGPLWAEQGVVYRSADGAIVNEGHLISHLALYLGGVNEPDGWSHARNIDVFLCPSWLDQRGLEPGEFVGRGILYQAEQRYFGVAKADVSLATQPKMFSEVPYPSRIAAFFETDCLDGTYYGNTGNERLAVQPVHGEYRHYLFFDGSVQAVSLEEQKAQQLRQRLR